MVVAPAAADTLNDLLNHHIDSRALL